MSRATRLLTFAAAYGAYVGFLHAVDGPWKRWDKGEVADKWTLTHVAWGALAKTWGLSTGELAALSVANEVGEAWVRRHRPDLLFGSPETVGNVAVDLATTLVAHAATPERK